ncbi:hypothetical protein PVPAM_050008700 [Plasmodium vivax]|nr:hypothetical protein PVPAM_050008700 [Plasmodium vivax]
MCTRGPNEESYQFFDNIVDYINKANNYENDDESGNISSNCDKFSSTWSTWFKNKLIAKSVCEELIKLYKSLDVLKAKSACSEDYKNECGFFNYRVNFKITESRGNKHKCASELYNAIESYFMDGSINYVNLYFIYDIDNNDLNKMNILYNLYENYSKLKAIEYKNEEQDKQQLLTHSSACCPDYIEANYICNPDNRDNNRKFCEKLDKFKTKYDDLYNEVVPKGSDYSKNFIKLSECPNTKIITTAVTGTVVGLIPLFGVLYKVSQLNIEL